MSEVTVKREHLAGLKLAKKELGELNIAAKAAADYCLDPLIAQASAAPEQEVVAVAIYSDASAHQEEWMRTKPFALVVGEGGVEPHLQRRIPGVQDVTIAYTHPNAEIERLRAENKRLDLALAQADHNYDCDRAQFEQKLAEAQALLRDARDLCNAVVKLGGNKVGPIYSHAIHLSHRIAALSATAQPAECCAPTEVELKLIADGEYRAEELWGGSRPTCPKCIGKATEVQPNE